MNVGARITHVALRADDGTIHSLPAPRRHHDVISMLQHRDISPHGMEQGFLTDTGFWMRRVPARLFALKTCRVSETTHARELFSEDLW